METSRRSFLIGGAAAVTALTLSPVLAKFDGILVKGLIEPRYRRVYDVLMSCDPVPRDIAINHTIYRDHDVLHCIRINARAAYRWVAVTGGELVFLDTSVMRYEVDPCHDNMQMCFHCEDRKGVKHAEFFEWQNDRLVRTGYHKLDIEPIEESLTNFRAAA